MSLLFSRGARWLATAVLAGASTATLATNGYFSHAYGTKSEGVAGAGIAYSQDSLVIAINPAGLVAVDGGFDIDVTAFQPDRGATLVQGGTSTSYSGNDTKAFLIPALGYSRHVGDRLAVGVALYGNGGMGWGLRRGEAKGFCDSSPDTPISHSAFS